MIAETFTETGDLPKIEPMKIPVLGLGQLNVKFKNAEIFGIKDAVIKSIRGFKKNPVGQKLSVHLFLPMVSISGPYEVYGQLTLFPVSITGTGTVAFRGVDIHLTFKTGTFQDDGEMMMSLETESYQSSAQG